jgi:phage pi2 protein 07
MTPLLKKVATANAKARARATATATANTSASASAKANAKTKTNAGILHYVQNDGGEGCFSMSRMTDEVEKIFS